ncbi:DUF1206 domain-containing protein [Salinibacterium sp. SYSU T00001]|uniref:DUF1206 domain-containing protein n=1 Tax=Homoserinimonas sedimenticola TaxID=2986805 RepID=UPI00223698A9|nr:DUF1206 domain-containing protein [Salinibacterium sedimenticola]MCW4386291.1 DUF1206 domain-containing protein [Salinibacterium sedimenticola]
MTSDGDRGTRERMREASHSRPVRWLARAGLVASGLVHALIGVLAISVVRGFSGNADQTGALQALAETPGGSILLWLATVCLIGLGLWQWTGSRTVRPDQSKVFPRWLRNHAKAVGFAAVGLACLAFAIGGRPDAAESARTVSSMLIDFPGGVFVLAALGIVVGAVGVAFVFRGLSRNFLEDIQPPHSALGGAIVVVGIVGHTMKGLALLVVGALFAGGALFTDSSWTSGLDGAIRWLAELPTGPGFLYAVAGGFMLHGVYLAARGVYIRR